MTSRRASISLAALLVVLSAASAASAQAPGVTYYRYPAAQPRTYYYYPTTPATRVQPRTYYYQPAPTYTYRSTPFTRYRTSSNAGRDPNWAARRGLGLFKPWEY